jgi:hypothetical protein
VRTCKELFSAQAKVETEIETAVKHHWELKAVDSTMMMMMMSSDEKELPLQEQSQKIIDNLIDNNENKNILVSPAILTTR